MNSIDKQKISKLLDQIRESKNRLEILSGCNKEDFVKDFKNLGSAKYHIIIGVEAMIDIANHIISRMKLGTPEDYADVFKILSKIKIFSDVSTQKFINMARYRNKLVHLYWKIDDAEVYDRLKDNIETFEDFENSISKHLKHS